MPASILGYKNTTNQMLLHVALAAWNKQLAIHLITQGMGLYARSIGGNTPLQLAMKLGEEMVGELKKALSEREIARKTSSSCRQ